MIRILRSQTRLPREVDTMPGGSVISVIMNGVLRSTVGAVLLILAVRIVIKLDIVRRSKSLLYTMIFALELVQIIYGVCFRACT